MGLTTDKNDPDLGYGSDDKPVPQQKKYLVLSEEELEKGFKRPVREEYTHVGNKKKVCGKPLKEEENEEMSLCTSEPGHEGDCYIFSLKSSLTFENDEYYSGNEGCGFDTKMKQTIAETYARDPKFYGATYCVHCNMHKLVGGEGEFVWKGTDIKVGT